MNTASVSKNTIEQQSLKYGAAVNLTMALAGWLAYYLSHSQALFLDGNFSFLMFISLFVAIRISAIKEEKTELFPYGQFVYEALYSLLKGIMITGVLLVAFIQNSSAIIHFFAGQETKEVNTTVILIYSIAMVILCFGSALYYRKQNKKTRNTSSILQAEYTAAIVDGFMSTGIGIVLVSIRYLSVDGAFGFLHYIGDSLLVLLLCVILGKGPVVLIRESFIEIAGGTLQNKEAKRTIETILNKYLAQNNLLTGSYISKTGSSCLVAAYLNSDYITPDITSNIHTLKEQISSELTETYPTILFEIVLT